MVWEQGTANRNSILLADLIDAEYRDAGMVRYGILKLNDATFSATTYPKLALVWHGLKLTDTRGEFIRVWDDGRGVDAGRSILTVQEGMIKRHEHHVWRRGDDAWINQSPNADSVGTKYLSVVHSATVIPGSDIDSLYAAPTGGSETRPRNIAFNFLVRAK